MGKYFETYIYVFSFLLDHKVLGLRLSYLITMIDVPTLIFFFFCRFSRGLIPLWGRNLPCNFMIS